MRRATVVFALLVAVALPATASAAPPLPQPLARVPASLDATPPGFALNGREAIRLARSQAKIRGALARRRLEPHAYLVGSVYWLVTFYDGRREQAEVEINGPRGSVVYALVGRELRWPPLARGNRTPYARKVHLLMVIAGLLFIAPFIDPRRGLRMLHLDLLAILALGVSFAFVEAGNVYASTPLRYPPFIYLAWRLWTLAVRRSERDPRPLRLPPARVMAPALVAVLVLRYWLDLTYARVGDVGYDSLFGAQSLLQGYPLFVPSAHLGSYGPAMYVAYAPFEALFKFDLSHAHLSGARWAAITWDLGTVLVLGALGRRLRGRELGLALAFAFAACPWSCFVLSQNSNDGLVGLLVALALLVASSPPGRALALAFSGAAKFAPLILGPLFLRTGDERGRRGPALYALTFVGAFALLIVAYLPSGGVRALWNTTLGYEIHRDTPFSIWGLHPSLAPAHWLFVAVAVVLVLASFVLPRERSVPRLAAASAALLVVAQLTSVYWYFFYISWFLPAALVAFIATPARREAARA